MKRTIILACQFFEPEVVPLTPKARILVVEDEEVIASMINFILDKDGYSVDITTDPDKGLALYKALKHDVVLLDLHMPSMSGLDLIPLLRGEGDPRLIIVSGSREAGIKARCIMDGACDYIEKPFRSADLRERIAFHLREAGKIKEGPSYLKPLRDGIPLGRSVSRTALADL